MGVEWQSSFNIKIGNGERTEFWNDIWIGESCLGGRFPRLFRLESKKEALVRERCGDLGSWDWVREPRGRACGELVELTNVIQNISLNAEKTDCWCWSTNSSGVFLVNQLRQLLEEKNANHVVQGPGVKTIWNQLIPKKICVFIWRAFRDRLPVRVALDKRGIDLDTTLCPHCKSEQETVLHCILRCDVAREVWRRLATWWGWRDLQATSIEELFNHPGESLINGNLVRVWQAVVWSAAYMLWKARNEKIFRNKVAHASSLIVAIQANSFNWISRRRKKGSMLWTNWCEDPIGSSRLIE